MIIIYVRAICGTENIRDDERAFGVYINEADFYVKDSTVEVLAALYGFAIGDGDISLKDSTVTTTGNICGMFADNILIDNSECVSVAIGDNVEVFASIYVLKDIELINILNADDYEVALVDANQPLDGYTLYYNESIAKRVVTEIYKLISIDVSKNKTEYETGDILKVDDITVTATYSDDTNKAVTGFKANVSEIDMSMAGEKVLTITYEEDGVIVTKDITIKVKAKELDKESDKEADKEPNVIPDAGDKAQNKALCLVMLVASLAVIVCFKQKAKIKI